MSFTLHIVNVHGKMILQHEYRPCFECLKSCCRNELRLLNACPDTLHMTGSIGKYKEHIRIQQKKSKLENCDLTGILE